MIMKTSSWWKRSQFIIWLSLALMILPGPTPQPVLAQTGPSLLFIENVGQFPAPPDGEALRFQVSGGQATLSFTDQALWLTMMEETGDDPAASDQAATQSTDPARRGVTIKLAFLKANPEPRLEPFNRLDTRISFFTGNDPALWHSDVPVWGGVRYIELYPGIDLVVTGENGQLVQQLGDKGSGIDGRCLNAGGDPLANRRGGSSQSGKWRSRPAGHRHRRGEPGAAPNGRRRWCALRPGPDPGP
jgi:hypothetical protein